MQNEKGYPRLGQAIVLIIALIVVQCIIGVVIAVALAIAKVKLPLSAPSVIGVGNTVSFAIILFWAFRKTKQTPREVFPLTSFPLTLLLPVVFTVVGLGVISSEGDNILRYFLPMPHFLADFFRNLTGMGIASIVTLTLVAPVTEEFLFRGIILKGFLCRYNHKTAIVTSAILFSFFHLNPYQFFPGFIAGVILGWIFTKTGSLWPCIICHALYNLQAFIPAVIPVAIPGYTQETLGSGVVVFQPAWFNVLGVASLVVGVLGLAKTFRLSRKPAEEPLSADTEKPVG